MVPTAPSRCQQSVPSLQKALDNAWSTSIRESATSRIAAQIQPSRPTAGHIFASVAHKSGLRPAALPHSLTGCAHHQRVLARPRHVLVASAAAASSDGGGSVGKAEIAAGTPVVIVEDPPFVKTAEPMPMLKRNSGQIKKGDVGRILDGRPKGVWAVRFARGAYLVDRKYFQVLSVEASN